MRKASSLEPLYTLYQPIVSVNSKRILGYEALTRGKEKLAFPEALFRLAYEKGCTVDVDFDCLRSAFRVLPELKKDQILFVNVEPITLSHAFRRGKEGEFLLKNVSAFGRQIVFELTEGMKIRDFRFVQQGVRFLRKWNCRFAIDDVGGLGQKLLLLLSLKPDFLKIDRSLIRRLGKGRFQNDLLRRIIRLAKKHKCILVAEGIEEKKDLERVQRFGIPYAQGFYFSLPIKKLMTRLKEKEAE